jgi:16S rRNA processing protein RimM
VLHSGQDVLVVKSAHGPDIMVPFVKALVPEVNVGGGYIVVDPPEGLLDLPSLP